MTAVLLAALVAVERRAAEPILPGWLWRRRELLGANLGTLGLGLVMMATSVYLPTFLQSVHGLGAIAAGLVLACISIGWPAASSLSGHVYLRMGFRNTAVLGALLMLLASLAFVCMPQPRQVWWIVLDQIALGAGLGLLSTPLLVGQQGVVGWARRGVVTGSNMFSRYLGESLGAAAFGAIFNSSIAARLERAPAALQEQLPGSVDNLLHALQDPATGTRMVDFLQHTVATATDHLYLGMAVGSVVIFLLLFIAPRRFPLVDEGQ